MPVLKILDQGEDIITIDLDSSLTYEEAARLKGVKPATIRKRVERGTLRAMRINGRVLLDALEVEKARFGSYGNNKRARLSRRSGECSAARGYLSEPMPPDPILGARERKAPTE